MKPMKKILILCIAIAYLITACQGSTQLNPTPSTQHQVIGTSGKTILVVIDPKSSNDRSKIMSVVNYLCSGKELCSIIFWDDINKAARSLPANAVQDQAIVATYILNKSTGFEQLLVCRLGEC
jgi:hypothetical protein